MAEASEAVSACVDGTHKQVSTPGIRETRKISTAPRCFISGTQILLVTASHIAGRSDASSYEYGAALSDWLSGWSLVQRPIFTWVDP